jgi:hypothetical protein
MTRTVVALYDDFASANAAVRDLTDAGFSRDEISMMAGDSERRYSDYMDAGRDVGATGASEGAGVGAGIGAVLGGLGGRLVGLGALVIPGIGPVIAAGPLAAALTGLAGAGVGAVAGGVTGGLLGALVDLGIPEESASYYAEGVRRGGTLLTVRVDDNQTDRAVDILNRHNPVDINQRVSQWRDTGWTAFDPNAAPYVTSTTTTSVEREWPSTRRDQDVTTSYSEMRESRTPDMNRYSDFSAYDTDFRNHFQTTLQGTGYSYDQYLPAYRYGYDLATDERYHDFDWNRLEPEARRYWDERNPGTWDRFKDAIHHAWLEIKDAVD